MHIGSLAQQAGTTTRTVRYYEEMGLIQPEGRSPGGFRCYSREQLTRLHMILSLKEMEFDLEHIKLILDKRFENKSGGKLASAILEDLNSRLEEVDGQIEHYVRLRDKLRRGIHSLCSCLPCELRLEDRLCANCDVLRMEEKEPLPFFHAVPSN
jgi:DNA-binding transcriptional MerR regulator